MVLVSDFDYTIYTRDDDTLIKNIEAINKYRSDKNLFIISTGRSITSIKKHIEEDNIKYDYLICEDGARIYDSNDNVISTVYMDKKDSLKIIDVCKKYDQEIFLDDGYSYIDIKDIDKCIKIVLKNENKEIVNKIVEELKILNSCYFYLSKNWINIINKDANKSNAINYLISKTNISKTDIYTIGDDINDYEMIINYNGSIMSKHHEIFDNKNIKQYDYFYELIEELMKN